TNAILVGFPNFLGSISAKIFDSSISSGTSLTRLRSRLAPGIFSDSWDEKLYVVDVAILCPFALPRTNGKTAFSVRSAGKKFAAPIFFPVQGTWIAGKSYKTEVKN